MGPFAISSEIQRGKAEVKCGGVEAGDGAEAGEVAMAAGQPPGKWAASLIASKAAPVRASRRQPFSRSGANASQGFGFAEKKPPSRRYSR
jgi:hypothetical protein